MYFGNEEVSSFYIGEKEILNVYLGELEVYSSATFQGLKTKPKDLSFCGCIIEQTLRIKATDGLEWEITNIPSWLTLSQTTGIGTQKITLTCDVLEEDAETTLVISGGEYSQNIGICFISVPLDEVWYFSSAQLDISPFSFFDEVGNLLTYEHTFSNGKGIIKCSANPYRINTNARDFLARTLYTLWLPASTRSFLNDDGTMPNFFLGSTCKSSEWDGVHLIKFYGASPCIKDNGNVLVAADSDVIVKTVQDPTREYAANKIVIQTSRAVPGVTITIPEGIEAMDGYSGNFSKADKFILPSTLKSLGSYGALESTDFTKLYCYFQNQVLAGYAAFFGRSNKPAEVHAPVGTTYTFSSYGLSSSSTYIRDL